MEKPLERPRTTISFDFVPSEGDLDDSYEDGLRESYAVWILDTLERLFGANEVSIDTHFEKAPPMFPEPPKDAA